MVRRIFGVSLFWFLLYPAPSSLAQPTGAGSCYLPIPSGVSWYGGTAWDATDARWEAIPGGTWTFDSGVGSSIVTDTLSNKVIGYHAGMEGWTGELGGGTGDWSNLWDLSELPAPLVIYPCAVQDTILAFIDFTSEHPLDQTNWAASPWVELLPGDLNQSGRVLVLDLYQELPALNYVVFEILVEWAVGGSPSGWIAFGTVPAPTYPECTEPGAPAVFDLSALIPSSAEEVRVGLGVVNYCSMFMNCTGASNTTPWLDNVRFGIFAGASPDEDNDGITDAEENGGPNSGDGNGDAIADRLQNGVVSLLDNSGSAYVVLDIESNLPPQVSPGFRCVAALAASSLPSPPGGAQFPCDLLEFSVIGEMPPAPFGVTVALPQACVTGRYFAYGATPSDTTQHWYEFDWNGTTGMKIVNGDLRLRLVDGQRGDDDLTENGIIVHRGGPAYVAGQPSAAASTVPNVVYEPGASLAYRVTVRDESGTPLNGTQVDVYFPPAITSLLCACPSFVNPATAFTDSAGVAAFTIQGGGCIDPDSVGAFIEVRADSTYLASVGGVSPDAVDASGRFPWQGWSPSGTCEVGLADAVQHAVHISVRSFSFCTDLDSDGRVSLIDAVLVTQSIKGGYSCP